MTTGCLVYCIVDGRREPDLTTLGPAGGRGWMRLSISHLIQNPHQRRPSPSSSRAGRGRRRRRIRGRRIVAPISICRPGTRWSTRKIGRRIYPHPHPRRRRRRRCSSLLHHLRRDGTGGGGGGGRCRRGSNVRAVRVDEDIVVVSVPSLPVCRRRRLEPGQDGKVTPSPSPFPFPSPSPTHATTTGATQHGRRVDGGGGSGGVGVGGGDHLLR